MKQLNLFNRSLWKLAYDRQMLEAPHRRTGAYPSVREDSRSGVTTQLPSEVEFPKRSNIEEAMISGLKYLENYISPVEELELLNMIDQQSWLPDLKRRCQHYGYKYDYKSKNIDMNYLGPLPKWLNPLCAKLMHDNIFTQFPDQVIVNEYIAGQGISPHIDSINSFNHTICSLSLGSSCVMDFTNDNHKISYLLEPRSLIIISGESRYLWKHGIAGRKCDNYRGIKIIRQRRVSLTFRNSLL